MTTFSTKILFVLATWLFCNVLGAQETLIGYWQPSMAINYKAAENYKHHFSLANRNYLLRDRDLVLEVRQVDLVHFSKWKVKDNQSVGLGVQYRIRDPFETGKGNELRLTQQFNIISKLEALRIGHRFRSEQRIQQDVTIHRFRYRFLMDTPLDGQKLDVGEPYLLGGTESLLSLSKAASPQFDQRFTLQIGWRMSPTNSLQGGIEYRFESFTQGTQQIVFLLTSWIVSL